ncbi:hypothetical protein [Pedobacter alpinus]|uniref:Uncharacterized protein n=1 Tax=Pedobacter alpinus TaxID=1590643 RepID=A0ABW5TU16_9SPHI
MYDNNIRSAKFVAAFNGTYLGLFTRIVAKTKNFKKKSNGNWKKFATICSSKIYGTVVDVNCGDPQLFGTPFKVEKRRRSYKSVIIEFLNSSKIISGQMMGVHSVGPNGNKLYLSKLLTW